MYFSLTLPLFSLYSLHGLLSSPLVSACCFTLRYKYLLLFILFTAFVLNDKLLFNTVCYECAFRLPYLCLLERFLIALIFWFSSISCFAFTHTPSNSFDINPPPPFKRIMCMCHCSQLWPYDCEHGLLYREQGGGRDARGASRMCGSEQTLCGPTPAVGRGLCITAIS